MSEQGLQGSTQIEEKKIIGTIDSILPFLRMSFTPGKCKETIETIEDIDEKELAYAGYYQQIAEFEKALKMSQPYLNHRDPYYRTTAYIIHFFSNLGVGDKTNAVKALTELENIHYGDDVPFDGGFFKEIVAITLFSGTKNLQLDENNLRIIPEGVRMYISYFIALNTLLSGKNEEAIGIAKSALMVSAYRYSTQSIYLNIVLGAAYTFLKEYEQADSYYKEAWQLAQQDDLYLAFVQQNILLLGFDRRYIKNVSPTELKAINQWSLRYIRAWSSLCNNVKGVADANLSIIEFTVGILFKHDFSVKEISSLMGIGTNTVKKHLVALRLKTTVAKRKEILKIDI